MNAALQAAVLAAALFLLQATDVAEARGVVGADAACAACDPSGPHYQLLRGDNQVHDCEVGFYCDCQKGKKLQCFAPPFIKWKYDENHQVCDANFDCKKFFDNLTTTPVPSTDVTPSGCTPDGPTPEPATQPTTAQSPQCACNPDGPDYQLLRGDNQVHDCEVGFYCDCQKGKKLQCFAPPLIKWKYDENHQVCDANFDCKKFFDNLTTTPVPPTDVTPSGSTPEPAPQPTTAQPPQCTCNPDGPDYQLLRGDNQVHDCEVGFYCDCRKGKKLQCFAPPFIKWKYDENHQVCDVNFDCKKFFDNENSTPAPDGPTPTQPTAPTTSAPPSSCSCGSSEPAFQLLRGDGQVGLCESGVYCHCGAQKVLKCMQLVGVAWRLNEQAQQCQTGFDCTDFFAHETTTAPSDVTPDPTSSSTTPASTVAPAPLAECGCAADGPSFQLVRGEDQASSCTHGYYCDCSQGKRLHCLNVLTLGWRFDEDAQKCRLFHSCEAFTK